MTMSESLNGKSLGFGGGAMLPGRVTDDKFSFQYVMEVATVSRMAE
jgi:hypothetical protein